jgi:hypothetical protein
MAIITYPQLIYCDRCRSMLYIHERGGVFLAHHSAQPDCPDAGKDFLIPTTDLEQYHGLVAEVPQDLLEPRPVDPAT